MDTLGTFIRIGQENHPNIIVTDAEYDLLEKNLSDNILATVDRNANATKVDTNLGVVAGVVELKVDDSPSNDNDIVGLAGAKITWTDLSGQPVSADLIYFDENPENPEALGAPDPSLTATSKSGLFLLYNVDLEAVGERQQRDLILTATKTGLTMAPVTVRTFPYNQNAFTFADILHQDDHSTPMVDGGYHVTSELWARSVLQVPGFPVRLIWKTVGSDVTPNGDRVVSGYFYASPDDFAYGSVYNPEVFVKIYIAANGWCNIAFNHVTVDEVDVSSVLPAAGISLTGAHLFFPDHLQGIVELGAGLAFKILDGLGVRILFHGLPTSLAKGHHVFNGMLTALG